MWRDKFISLFDKFGAAEAGADKASIWASTRAYIWPENIRLRRVLPALLILLLLYYGIGAALIHQINDDINFAPPAPTAAGVEKPSRAVDIAAALIDREAVSGHWAANDPFFYPSAILDNMPNYQQGMIYALSRFAVQMADQLGRARGSSQVDADLDRAAGLLKYPGTVWLYDSSISLLPTASSESQYRAARKSLLAYNARVASGQAIFDRRADNLIAALDNMGTDLGSQSAVIDKTVLEDGAVIGGNADDVYYATKGRLYAYALLVRGLGEDFKELIQARDLTRLWANLEESLNAAAGLQPLVVINGTPDSSIMPSHLAAQGFYLLRARIQLREVSNALQQ